MAEDSNQNANMFNMIVLKVKSSLLYTIPSFSAITLKLSHAYVRAKEDTGVVIRVFPWFSDPESYSPKGCSCSYGCIVKVYS